MLDKAATSIDRWPRTAMLRYVDDFRWASGHVSRREWLRIGSLAGLGLVTGTRLHGAEQRPEVAAGFGRAKSVILVFASGGQSQIDMWAPRPLAPLDVRGDFRPIATAIPGVQFCKHLARIAARKFIESCGYLRRLPELEDAETALLARSAKE